MHQMWIENESKRDQLTSAVEEAAEERAVFATLNSDGSITGNWSEDEYHDGIIEWILERALEIYNENPETE